MEINITKGKKYYWNINNYSNKTKTGLFTGNFDQYNGNAILMTKTGETWSIPLTELKEGDGK